MNLKGNFKLIAASTVAVAALLSTVAFAPNAEATDARQRAPRKSKKAAPAPTPTPCPDAKEDTTPIVLPPVTPPPVRPPRPGQRPGPIIPIPDFPDIPSPGDDKQGPEVPFPMSTTLPFPWDKIEGIWNAKGQGIDLFFSFRVQTDRDGRQFLAVEQLDAKTGELVAQGVGLSVENDKLVRAAMSGSFGGAYMLFIGSYKDPKSLAPNRIPRSVTVLTVRSFSNMVGQDDQQFTVSKVSNLPYSAENPLPNPVINN
jgi:hypothetical protein